MAVYAIRFCKLPSYTSPLLVQAIMIIPIEPSPHSFSLSKYAAEHGHMQLSISFVPYPSKLFLIYLPFLTQLQPSPYPKTHTST